MVLLEPLELPETGLTHGESDLALLGVLLVEVDAHDPGLDDVADGEVPSGVLADEPLVGLVDVHAVVHDLADVQEAVERTEPDERTELEDLNDLADDDLVVPGLEHDLVELHGLVDRPVPVDDTAGTYGPDVLDQHGEVLVLSKAALVGLPGEAVDDAVYVILQVLRRNAHDLLDLG